MKKTFLFFLFSFLVFDGRSQYNEKQQTEVIVIGTIHFPTKRINADTIYKAVAKVKPDIILIESGTSNFTNGTFKENNYEENEWKACKAYKVNYPTTKFFPFDIEGRDEIRKQLQINGDNPFIDYLFVNDSASQLSKTNKAIFDRFMFLNILCDSIYNSSLENINTNQCDNILYERQFYQYIKLTELANSIEEIKSIKSSAKSNLSLYEYNKRWSAFELQRNFEMTENILNVIKKNPSKRIVILVGFYHRYSIIKTLQLNQNKFNFKLKEYYQ